jgi:hypothetical protein
VHGECKGTDTTELSLSNEPEDGEYGFSIPKPLCKGTQESYGVSEFYDEAETMILVEGEPLRGSLTSLSGKKVDNRISPDGTKIIEITEWLFTKDK